MYQCKELNKSFETKEEMFKELILNKSTVIAQKKSVIKQADGIGMIQSLADSSGVKKEYSPITEDISELKVTAVINTTNLMDSHGDVHFPGIWNKSLKENRSIMHLQEHQMQFDKIISDGNDLKAYVSDISWKELGYNYIGHTQALVFESTVKSSRNTQMFKEYKNANVRNHSVGMRYVKMELAVNSDEDWAKEEKETWDKYIGKVANRDMAEAEGHFWAVTEAKVIEGSAVPIGSNHITPTLHNKNIEAEKSLHTEPSNDTQTFIDILKQIKI